MTAWFGETRIHDHLRSWIVQANSAAGVVRRRPSVPLTRVWWYSVNLDEESNRPGPRKWSARAGRRKGGIGEFEMVALEALLPTGEGERQEQCASMRFAAECPYADERVMGRITIIGD